MNRNRYNVLWKPGKANEAHAHAVTHGLKHVPYEHIDNDTNWRVYEIPPGIAKKEQAWIEAHPNFGGIIEPEGFGEVIPIDGAGMSVPDDTEGYQQFLRLGLAHTVTKGAGVTVAVFDNGLQPPAAWQGRLIGEQKLFRATETNGVLGGSHGQPVTYLDFAAAPDCTCTNYKIASAADVRCSWTDFTNALLYAKQQGHKIGNLSYGGGSSSLLASTLATMKQAGFALFVATGNSGGATQFPASDPNVYAVAALNTGEEGLAGFSCRGKVELATPGTGLLTCNNSGGWSGFSGTSGATPLASGLAALVLAKNPSWTGIQCAEHLIATKRTNSLEGYPIPDAANAVGYVAPTPPPGTDPVDKPAAPTGLFATDITTSGFTVNWSQAPYSGGIARWEVFNGDFRCDQVKTTSWRCQWWQYGTARLKKNIRVRAVGYDGKVSDLSDYLDESVGSTPPTETWTAKSSTTLTEGEWSPTTATQNRDVTVTTRTWEESNLGNVRNDSSVSNTTQESRDVNLPTT